MTSDTHLHVVWLYVHCTVWSYVVICYVLCACLKSIILLFLIGRQIKLTLELKKTIIMLELSTIFEIRVSKTLVTMRRELSDWACVWVVVCCVSCANTFHSLMSIEHWTSLECILIRLMRLNEVWMQIGSDKPFKNLCIFRRNGPFKKQFDESIFILFCSVLHCIHVCIIFQTHSPWWRA